jgi:2-keto-4-pentenoate hydratase
MASDSLLHIAAATLVNRRIHGDQGEVFEDVCRPKNTEQALAIQQEVSQQWCERLNDSIGGWKCLLPPNPDKIVVAPIYTSSINTFAPISVWPLGESVRIEPELAFYFGQDLPAREQPYSSSEIDEALSRSHMALELIYCRYSEPSQCTHYDMLADGLVNQGLFVGPQVDNILAEQASQLKIHLDYAQHQAVFDGKHPDVQPKAGLYWLVEFLRERGTGIEAGQVVITGSYAGVIDVPLNTDINIEYAGLGKMQVQFRAKKA